MRVFISGGCKNGKSTLAQDIAVAQRLPGSGLYYVATMISSDSEDDRRIERHQSEREGMGFVTVERGRGIGSLADKLAPEDSVLLDSLTALLSNELFKGCDIDKNAPERVDNELFSLLTHCKNIVIVSDYIYGDGGQYTGATELYRQGLARLDRCCASLCDTVLELCGGVVITHKGGLLHEAAV